MRRSGRCSVLLSHYGPIFGAHWPTRAVCSSGPAGDVISSHPESKRRRRPAPPFRLSLSQHQQLQHIGASRLLITSLCIYLLMLLMQSLLCYLPFNISPATACSLSSLLSYLFSTASLIYAALLVLSVLVTFPSSPSLSFHVGSLPSHFILSRGTTHPNSCGPVPGPLCGPLRPCRLAVARRVSRVHCVSGALTLGGNHYSPASADIATAADPAAAGARADTAAAADGDGDGE